jgi:hypothetical protein
MLTDPAFLPLTVTSEGSRTSTKRTLSIRDASSGVTAGTLALAFADISA